MMFLVFINLFLLLNGFPQQLTERQYRNIGYNMRPVIVPQGLIPFLDSEAIDGEHRERRNPDLSEEDEASQFLPQHEHSESHFKEMAMKPFVDLHGNKNQGYEESEEKPAQQFARLTKQEPSSKAGPKEDDKEQE